MKFELSNINKIKHASVEVGGLTVIAGINDSGKSTVGKTLFCTIKAITNGEGDLTEYKTRIIRDYVERIYRRYHLAGLSTEVLKSTFFPPRFMEEIRPYIEKDFWDVSSFEAFLNEKLSLIEKLQLPESRKKDTLNYLHKISHIILQANNTTDLLKEAFNKAINSEFMGNICTENTGQSSIILSDDTTISNLTLKDNMVADLYKNPDAYLSLDDITFLETPLYLQLNDFLSRGRSLFDVIKGNKMNRFAPIIPYHIKDLINKLELSKYSSPSSFSKEWNIESIIGGRFKYDKQIKDFCFSTTKNGSKINLQTINVASGIKTFGIIQLLLEADELNSGKMLVIDEPENHLHPQWQIECAHLIVNLVKEGIPVMVSSHSPYFIQGIRYYADMEEINDLVKYYLAENDKESDLSIIEDVTNDLNKIFIKLSEPLNKIMNLK